MKIKSRSSNPFAKRARKGFRGFPVATVAFYGPDDQRASKLVVGIINHERAEPKLRQWYSDDSDLRSVPEIGSEIKAFLKEHDVVSVSMVDRIIGCPHEEGIDYPYILSDVARVFAIDDLNRAAQIIELIGEGRWSRKTRREIAARQWLGPHEFFPNYAKRRLISTAPNVKKGEGSGMDPNG